MTPTPVFRFLLPPSWREKIEQAAEQRGQTPSEWIRSAIRKALPAEVRRELSEPQKPGRPSQS